MAIDFRLPPEVTDVRDAVRDLMRNEVSPTEERLRAGGDLRA